MERAYNFSPGPCGLPDAVMMRAREEFLSYGGEGASAMEISHRGAAFIEIYERAVSLLRELLDIGDDYDVLFLTGGATGQAAMAPMNLIPRDDGAAAYLITGYWSRRAAEEAKKYCRVQIVADTADDGHTSLPADIAPAAADSAYLHYADNETIHGVEFPRPPASSSPLLSDMSSNILSRPIRVRDYGMIYAGAQKNLGAAGVTVVVVRRDLVCPRPWTPAIWNYREQSRRESMINTPPTYPIYMTGLVLQWIKNEGGAEEMARRAAAKSRMLYDCIDRGFYRSDVPPRARSRMNVPFFLPDESLTAEFLAGARDGGMIGLQGHAVLGGCRASLYNAMPVAGVRLLTDYMSDFARRRG